MRLLRAEFARLFARRFTKLMLLGVVAALAIIAAVTASETTAPTPEERRQAEVRADSSREECLRAQAEESERAGQPVDFQCDQIGDAAYESYVLEFRQDSPTLLLVCFGLLTLFGYLVGASFLGVEWSSGGMANLLLWRTQRIRVLLGKLTALLSGVFLIGLVVAAAWVGVIWLIARFRGSFGELTDGFWVSLGLTGARGMGMALIATAFGAAVASLGRRTAAALGLLIGYLVIWEIGARIVMEALEVPAADRFVFSSYVAGLVENGHEVVDYRNCFDMSCEPLFVITWWLGAAVLGGVALLAVLLATWSFRRRDVT